MLKYLGLIGLLLLVSCGKSATIRMTDGRYYEGEIVRSDDKTISISSFGGLRKINKDSIGDIDHPGNALAATGASLTGYFFLSYIGSLNAISSEEDQCNSYSNATCNYDRTLIHLLHIPLLIPSISMFLYGYSNWNNSVQHVNGSNVNMTLSKDAVGAIYTYNF